METDNYGELDIEWIQLIKEALDLGLEKEEIRSFLANGSTQHLVLDK
ncbi:anti-repressor SinI family protein [Mesobacillus maritimus]